jgi:acid phosphatase type 7
MLRHGTLVFFAWLVRLEASYAPEQIHLTLHPSPKMLVVSWVSFELNPSAALVQYGASPDKLIHYANGSFFAYPNDLCPTNSTRSIHTVPFPVDEGVQVFYRVSNDGTLWSDVFNATGIIQTKATQTFSIFGDLAVYNANNAVPALINDTRDGVHDFIVHYGDVAYNMDDGCGAVGDEFFRAAQAYSTQTPVVYSNGASTMHEGRTAWCTRWPARPTTLHPFAAGNHETGPGPIFKV